MSQDPASADTPLTEYEAHALRLAQELRERVRRERHIARRLRNYLAQAEGRRQI